MRATVILLSLSLVTGLLACDAYDLGQRCDAVCSVRSVGRPRVGISGGAARVIQMLPVAAIVRSLDRPLLGAADPVWQLPGPFPLPPLPTRYVLRI